MMLSSWLHIVVVLFTLAGLLAIVGCCVFRGGGVLCISLLFTWVCLEWNVLCGVFLVCTLLLTVVFVYTLVLVFYTVI